MDDIGDIKVRMSRPIIGELLLDFFREKITKN